MRPTDQQLSTRETDEQLRTPGTDERLSTRDLASSRADGEPAADRDRGVTVAGTSAQASAADRPADSATTANGDAQALLAPELSASFTGRWEEVQTRFVDEPRGAVEDADRLVANVMQHLAEGFAQERERLETHWGRGEDISTEDLRVALQRYRSFFQRLLSA